MRRLNLFQHCRDDQHREYVRDKSHFEKLDQLIKTVPSPASFFRKEKFKALETQNKQRKPKRYVTGIKILVSEPVLSFCFTHFIPCLVCLIHLEKQN